MGRLRSITVIARHKKEEFQSMSSSNPAFKYNGIIFMGAVDISESKKSSHRTSAQLCK